MERRIQMSSIKKLVRSKGEELIASGQALAYIKQPEKIK
jgi:hypothetical protein